MKVFKFGGASVKDSSGIRNLAKILSGEKSPLVVVVSAFGKTTNSLEKVLKAWLDGKEHYIEFLDNVYNEHLMAINGLFLNDSEIKGKIDNSFAILKEHLLSGKKGKYDFEYDQIVSNGEIWSTIIVEAFLKQSGMDTAWIDIRESLITDNRFRDANILWDETSGRIKSAIDFSKETYTEAHKIINLQKSNKELWEIL